MTTKTFHIGEIEIPAMALGTMYFGTRVATGDSLRCLDEAYEQGARFWDTANNYAFWAGGVGNESESVIGDWVAANGAARRDQVTIATKVGARPRVPGVGLEDSLGLSPDAVRNQMAESLRRLRTDHVDVIYAHIDDVSVPFEETLGVFGELVAEGKARAVAASNLTAPRLRESMSTDGPTRYAALQQRFTYLEPDPQVDLSPHVLLTEEVSQVCDQFQLTRLGYSSLLSGAYNRSDKPFPDGYSSASRALTVLKDVGHRHRLDAGQTVLSWMVNRNSPVVPIVGVSRPEQIRAAWQAVTTPLGTADTSLLDDARHE